ncbi:class III lanthionine synthetase LanKC [Mammaliicoccus fleurettii]|uniref:class III lanthionine synthetase LanKC n=1 Tax=Mammaliicoccus fleurettii TaxID=150056 RepID=UPI002DBC7741|nr:class III lanthionine synthetase LanKC [Mammaliicoccus fleurettii]MEB7725457.1 class III lanthionine synthetase LanKC [Mammaliicoccus fleurettii]
MQPIKNSVHNQLLPFNNYTYESTESYKPKTDYIKETLNLVLKTNGVIKNNGLWTYIDFGNNLPDQGWKIHVSATLGNDNDILKIVTQYCSENKVTFKHLSDKNMLVFLNGKYNNRGSAGKFITIYPINTKEFKKILEDLYPLLKKYEGSYILSDKRYKDCKVLYYRYGGIKGKTFLNYRGEQEYYLRSPDGEMINDTRHAYWNPPYWIEDPFDDLIKDNDDENDLLHDRYEINNVIEFSADGGVYLGTDTLTNNKVVIKEARPNTAFDFSGSDAIDRLENEYSKLDSLKDFDYTPDVIEKFYEWEHLFLVEEFLEGETLNSYMMSISPIMQNNYNKDYVVDFNNNLKNVYLAICKIVDEFHNRNMILQDISPRNIIINQESNTMKFIDLETAYLANVENPTNVKTPGFYDVNETENDKYKVEIKNLSYLFFSCIFPVNSIFTLSNNKLFDFLNSFVNYGVLNSDLGRIIKSINVGEINSIDTIYEKLDNVNISKSYVEKHDLVESTSLEQLISGIEKSVISEIENMDNQKIFSSDPMGIFTNKLGMAYGASGVIYGLLSNSDKTFELDKVISWILLNSQGENIPANLFNGYAGIAYVLADLNYHEASDYLIKKANTSDLLKDCYDLFYGLAGVGLSNLKLYKEINDIYYLNEAIKIGDTLIEEGISNQNGNIYWPDKNNSVFLGFGRGSSGIALYLLYLYYETKDDKYLKCGIKAIKFEIDNVHYNENGLISILRGELSSQENVQSPYLYDGACGLGSVLLRYKKYIEPNEYNQLLDGILKESLRKYVAFPSLMRGVSGLGHFMLDCYLLENKQIFMDQALEVADTLNIFAIKKNDNVYFAGEQLFRYSSDYSTGSSGVITFLNRLKNFDNNPYNHNYFLDHYYKNELNI